jgi:hypothetical protein
MSAQKNPRQCEGPHVVNDTPTPPSPLGRKVGGADAQPQLIPHRCKFNPSRRWHWNLGCVNDYDSSCHDRGGTSVGGGRRRSTSGAGGPGTLLDIETLRKMRPRWPMTQHGTEKRPPRKVVSTDRSALLWMYCREIAPYETPTFIKNVGELIARATSASQKRGARARRIRTPRGTPKLGQ